MTAYVFTSGGFPASPVAGDTLAINSAQYDWNGTTWQARAAGGNFSTLTTNSETAPTSPLVGDRWFNTTNGVLVQYFSDGTDSAWLDIAKVSGSSGAVGAAATGGVTAYADIAALIAVTPSTGDMALVQDISKMFVYTGTGWFLIATVTNGTPSAISGVAGSYSLSLDGTATVITAASTDPEGFPLTWSYSVTTGSLGSTATVTQADNVFTITPSTDAANAGTFGITFSVTDGATGVVTQVSNFELNFSVPLLWRLYISNASSFGLTDIDPSTTTGWFNSSNVSMTASLTANYGNIPSAGTYGIYMSATDNPYTDTSYNGTFDAGPGSFLSDSNSGGSRTAWVDATGQWIYIYFNEGFDFDNALASTLNLRTFSGSRPDRTPRQMLLQHYTGLQSAAGYDSTSWTTYATLNNTAQNNGNPTYTNITEGSVVSES